MRADTATRPGPHGQRVISTGLDDLDKIFGGGIPLGSVCLIEEDGWTSHHSVLLRYFASEGVLAGQVRRDSFRYVYLYSSFI